MQREPFGCFLSVLTLAFALATTAHALPGDDDPTFGSNGFVTTDPGSGSWGALAGLIDPLGRIVAVGDGGNRDMAVTRHLPDGSPDASFGIGGLVTIDLPPDPSTNGVAWAVARQSDGKLVLAGERTSGGQSTPALLRLNEDGTIDTAFGTGGFVLLPSGGYFYDVALQADGAIVAAGTQEEDFLIARFTPGGMPDPTLAGTGLLTLDVGSEYDVVRSVRIQSDGKILAIGSGGIDLESEGIAIARYNSNGSIDVNFGNNGVVVVDDRGEGFAGTLQSDGKILATSSIPIGLHDEIAVTRLNADGAIDTTFADNGTFRTSVLDQHIYYPRAMVQQDGISLLVGSLNFNSSVVFRLRDDGEPDLDFASTGSRVFFGRYIWSLAQQPTDQKVVGFGAVIDSNNQFWNVGLVRLDGVCPAGPDSDGDGISDACDPCTSPIAGGHGKLSLRRLGAAPDDDVVRLKLIGTIPPSPPIDPIANGVRLVLRDATGRTRLDARFANLTTTPISPPVAGIDRVRVTLKPDGRARIKMVGHAGNYEPGSLPLTAMVSLDPPTSANGQCLEVKFAPGECSQTPTLSGVTCRHAVP